MIAAVRIGGATMQKPFTLAVACALAATLGCGKSDMEKQAEQAAKQAEQAAAAATRAAEAGAKAGQAANDTMAKGMEDFAKAMSGMAGAMSGDGKTVEPVTFQSLQTVLPELAGWEMEKPHGERMTSPMPYSQTETTYRKGDARIEVKVVDSGFASFLIMPWSMMLASGYSKETSDGYEKAVKVKEQPAFEKWDSDSKNGELNILVNKRFLVSIESNDIADTKPLHEIADKMDFSRFASLK
jgi:hypothetical protein